MIDKNFNNMVLISGEQSPMRRPTPKRHFSYSFQSNDVSVCNNVSVRSIIDRLGEKLDVGEPRGQGVLRSRSFQSNNSQLSTLSGTKSRSKSMLISPLDHPIANSFCSELPNVMQQQQPSHDVAGPMLLGSPSSDLLDQDQRIPPKCQRDHQIANSLCSDLPNVMQQQQPSQDVAEPMLLGSPSSDLLDQDQRIPPWLIPKCHRDLRCRASSNSPFSNRSRWSVSRGLNRSDLPPAFRSSLDSSILGSPSVSSQGEGEDKLSQIQTVVLLSGTQDRNQPSPSKLQRKWPPVPRKRGRPSQLALLESTLSDLRLLARVKSQICSFEPPLVKGSCKEPAVQLETGLSSGANDEGGAKLKKNGIQVQRNTAVKPEDEFSQVHQENHGLVSAVKSRKCKASLRIRWSGPEVFFIEARSTYQQPYYDDLLEDRFQSGGEQSGAKPLVVDRFDVRVKDCLPDLPRRPRRDDDWSDCDGDSDNEVNAPLQQHRNEGSESMNESCQSVSPSIWITMLEKSNCEGTGLQWRVKRVWDNDSLDSREKERIIPDENLMNTLKNLSGLSAIPTESVLSQDDKGGRNSDEYSSLNWSIKKVYDINGEIIDDVPGILEKTLDETSLLREIVALASEFGNKSVLSPSCIQSTIDDSMDIDFSSSHKDQPTVDLSHNLRINNASHAALEEGKSPLRDENCQSRGEKYTLSTPSDPETECINQISSVLPSAVLDTILHKNGRALKGVSVDKESTVVVDTSLNTSLKRSKKRKDYGTIADLLSPPPITTFYDAWPN